MAVIPTLGFMGAILCLWKFGIGFFEVTILVVMYTATVIGVEVGFHRYFTHKTFEAKPWVKMILAVLGSMACEGPIIFWVANHRRHHAYSDQPNDPHSPYIYKTEKLGGFRGFWHAHMGWTFDHEAPNTAYFAKDLLRDPGIFKVNKWYFYWIFIGLLAPTLLGGVLIGTWIGAFQGLLFGGLARIFLVQHASFSVNSFCHMFGRQAFNTGDHSKNNIWLAIPTFGQAWHNNHHAFPNSAKMGFNWWQVDLGGWFLWMLGKLNWVSKVRGPTT